ncbi:MAG: hypothetical protein GAK45_00705 [Pseudomonas citronellolis]|nr:MAG: hypothetical protein GAK45_00705 [Pseudomonas citronellolis]
MKFLTSEQLNTPRSRRLRKKLRVGEFQEFGFSLEFTYDAQAIGFDAALDQWIDFVEAQGWVFGGGGEPDSGEITGYLCQAGTGSLSEADRETVRLWLQAQAWCNGSELGELSDCWHSLFD